MPNIGVFQRRVLSWYRKHKRALPWRKTKDPYAILISEVMLQQTQVDRVIPYFQRWMKRFPDFRSLSRATPKTVLTFWSGLGYNNRAIRMQKLAKTVMTEYDGKLPTNEESLRNLPGVGTYTAAAILAFSHNKETAVIDTNIRRVLIHELKLSEHITPAELYIIAKKAIPRGKSRIWHNALMDYGAKVQTARKTGIRPLSRQAKFEGSARQVRGAIVKLLLKNDQMSKNSLRNEFSRKDLDAILEKMAKDHLIQKQGKNIRLL